MAAMFKPGQIVQSIAGHDKGGFFLVTGMSGGYVLIADGKARKLGKPKRKNRLHIRPTNASLELSLTVTDKKLRNALAAYRGENDEGEECKLCQSPM